MKSLDGACDKKTLLRRAMVSTFLDLILADPRWEWTRLPRRHLPLGTRRSFCCSEFLSRTKCGLLLPNPFRTECTQDSAREWGNFCLDRHPLPPFPLQRAADVSGIAVTHKYTGTMICEPQNAYALKCQTFESKSRLQRAWEPGNKPALPDRNESGWVHCDTQMVWVVTVTVTTVRKHRFVWSPHPFVTHCLPLLFRSYSTAPWRAFKSFKMFFFVLEIFLHVCDEMRSYRPIPPPIPVYTWRVPPPNFMSFFFLITW